MIDGFILGVFLMVGFLIVLTVVYAYGMLIAWQVRRRSPLLVITAGLPALLLLAGIAGAILS